MQLWSPAACLRLLRSPWTDYSQGYHRVTLRFRDPQREAGYVLHQRDLLVQRAKHLCYLSLSFAIFTLLHNIILLKRHRRETFASDMGFESAKISLLCLTAAICIIMLFLASLHWNRLMASLRPAVFERLCVGMMFLVMVLIVLRPPEMITKMQGVSIEEAFGGQYFSDAHMLLAIDGIITAAHLGFPVRWCSMLPLEITSILLYMVILFVIGSNEPMANGMWSLCGLTGLTVASALGKRAAEMRERQHYNDIINEKSLRCAAEFELSRTAGKERPKPPELLESPGTSNQGSAPHTTPGSQVFDGMFQQNVNVTEKLTHIMELGDAEHWRINEAEIKVLPGVLGSGGFGEVVMAIFCGAVVAVKLPRNQLQDSDMPRLPDLCNELRVFRHVRHPNIAAVQGAVIAPQKRNIALVIEFIKGMVLDAFLIRGGSAGGQPGIPERYSVMLGVCNALLYLHTRCPLILHGDIKGSNVMAEPFRGFVRAKLLDFGLSRVLTRHARPPGGTVQFSAPEVVRRDGPVKCSADVYSFGRLTTFIATSTQPLHDMTKAEIKKSLKRRAPPPPQWPPGCPFEPSCSELVRACLQVEEGDRPGILEVHARLLTLPQELDLSEDQRQLLEDVHAVRAQLPEPADGAGAEQAGEASRTSPAQAEPELGRRTRASSQGGWAVGTQRTISL